MIRFSRCYLCDRELTPIDLADVELPFQVHPKVEDCEVEYTDEWGIYVDGDAVERAKEAAAQIEDDAPSPGEMQLDLFPLMDVVLDDIFKSFGLARLGGPSTGRGWSSVSLFQQCPYAWKRRYVEAAKHFISVESPAIAVGSLIHTFLAVQYMRMIVADYPVTPDMIHERVRLRANPKFVEEGWRVYQVYRLLYKHEAIQPLAIEHNLRDPRTNESCRLDMIAYFPEDTPMQLAGTYIVEHKSTSKFDRASLEGWAGDGEILGQLLSWRRLGLDKRFGPLRGVIINLCGKQKEPKFERIIVSPVSWQIEDHAESIRQTEGFIQLALRTNVFPRYRANCIHRYGFCQWFDHCNFNR